MNQARDRPVVFFFGQLGEENRRAHKTDHVLIPLHLLVWHSDSVAAVGTDRNACATLRIQFEADGHARQVDDAAHGLRHEHVWL